MRLLLFFVRTMISHKMGFYYCLFVLFCFLAFVVVVVCLFVLFWFACLLLSLLFVFSIRIMILDKMGFFIAVVLFACLLLRLLLFLLLLLFWCVISFGPKFWTISTFCLAFFFLLSLSLFFSSLSLFFFFLPSHYFLSRRTNVTLQKYSGILLLLYLPFAFCNNLYLSLYVWIKQTTNI